MSGYNWSADDVFELLTEGIEPSPGCMLAIKQTGEYGYTSHGFRWPLQEGATVNAEELWPGGVDPGNRAPCPLRYGDGLCVGFNLGKVGGRQDVWSGSSTLRTGLGAPQPVGN